ncbi:alkaline protease secretion protein AprF [soil metagenome]
MIGIVQNTGSHGMTSTLSTQRATPTHRFGPLVFAMSLAGSTAALAQPLPELFGAALSRDPAVASAQAQVRAAEQRVVQAQAAFGPTVALTGGYNDNRYREAPLNDPRSFYSAQLTLQLTQPLVRNALYFGYQSAQAQLLQTQAQFALARDDAVQRFVEACFDVLKSRDTLAFTLAQRALTEEQLSAAQHKYRAGSSPITDVREAEAKADAVAAQLAAAEFDLEFRQQVLAEIVGRAAPGLLGRGLTGEHLPEVPLASVPQWLADAMADNKQVQQAQRGLDAAAAEVQRATQAHTPTVDLIASYNMNKDNGTVTSVFPRRGDAAQLGVNFTIPIFARGATQSKVVEAVALQDKAQSDVEAARRTVSLSVRQGFSNTLSSTAQARALGTAVTSAEVALRANRRGYEAGLRVNAEVLDAQTRLFEAQRDLSKARYDAWVSYTKLKAGAGQWREDDLERLDRLLVAVEAPPPRRVLRSAEGRIELLPQERATSPSK